MHRDLEVSVIYIYKCAANIISEKKCEFEDRM